MEIIKQTLLILILFFCLLIPSSLANHTHQTYIVHTAHTQHPATFSSLLTSLPPPHHPKHLLYTYQHAIHGFAAVLTDTQASFLRNLPGILRVTPERTAHLHTTHSPEFLGLSGTSGFWSNLNYGDDVIIGVIDTGVWPESRSFNDEGLGPVPAKWKGRCVSGLGFPISSCNKKLIGAKYLLKSHNSFNNSVREENQSPRDTNGHGTHTASTAGGSSVENANFDNLANGEARGVASKSRLAIYKVCSEGGCRNADILAAIEEAISDGVDIISMSLGSRGIRGPDYAKDPLAIGAFNAVLKGILVSCSAGNDGPKKMTLKNMAPWILTVGASSIDRDFPAHVKLGDGSVHEGISLHSGKPIAMQLVYAKDHGDQFCLRGKLQNVKGKIVLCDAPSRGISEARQGSTVKQAEGAAMILISDVNTGPGGPVSPNVLPAVIVDPAVGVKIRRYTTKALLKSLTAHATINFKGTIIGREIQAPKVAQFSSRGPNHITPEILKPDLIAPGVNILAGWTGANSPTGLPTDTIFNIASGTSMACPHVSGLAALLLNAHPEWSPAAIKSALMTTAYNSDKTGKSITDLATGKPSTPFDHGAGHVDPNKAIDPGLVYDLRKNDYYGFLCSIYSKKEIAIFTPGISIDCTKLRLAHPGDFNYPSFSVVFKPGTNTVTYKREVKNVGKNENAVYNVQVSSLPDIKIDVSPETLEFSPGHQSLSYTVTFSAGVDVTKMVFPQFGWIEWNDVEGNHKVRSPVALASAEMHYISAI